MEPFRNDLEAALARQQELERENAELKEQLEQALHPPAESAPTPPRATPAPAPKNRGIYLTLAATVALSGVISYVISARPTVQEVPVPTSTVPTLPTTPPPHVDFAQPGTPPAKDAWVAVPLPVKVPLYAIAAGAELTYASGAKGTVLRRHSAEDVWSQETSGTDASLYGIAIQMDRVVAVGEHGTVVALPSQTAKEFRVESSGTKETLRAVSFSHLGAVAVGDHGTLLTRTGSEWKVEKSGTTETLRAVCAGLRVIFIAGDHGTILHREGDKWLLDESGSAADLRGISCDEHSVVAVGAGGVVVQRDDPRAGFKVRTTGGAEMLAVDSYYGSTSWIAVGRAAAVQRGVGAAEAAGLHGDLYAVRQSSMGTCVVGDDGLFVGAPFH